MVKYKNIIQTIEDYLTKHPINEKARNIGKTGKWTTQTNEKGEIIAKMDVNDCGRFIQTIIPPNSSIGPHLQESNDDINFIVSGEGIAICDDVEEILKPGTCHICPKGSSHSIINNGDEDLVFFTLVPK